MNGILLIILNERRKSPHSWSGLELIIPEHLPPTHPLDGGQWSELKVHQQHGKHVSSPTHGSNHQDSLITRKHRKSRSVCFPPENVPYFTTATDWALMSVLFWNIWTNWNVQSVVFCLSVHNADRRAVNTQLDRLWGQLVTDDFWGFSWIRFNPIISFPVWLSCKRTPRRPSVRPAGLTAAANCHTSTSLWHEHKDAATGSVSCLSL